MPKRIFSPDITLEFLNDAGRNTMVEHCGIEFTEVGPGKVLAGLLKRIDRKAKCENVNEAL